MALRTTHTLSFPLSSALLLSAAAAQAEGGVAHISLNTATQEITVETTIPGAPTVDWLQVNEAGFSGKLPELQSPTRINGWSPEASYLTGGGWLPEGADGEAAVPVYDITLSVPARDHVAVTGRILSDHVEGAQRHVRFRFEGPQSSLGIFVGAYDLATRTHDDLTLRTYFTAAEAELSDRYLAASGEYIDRFSAEIGPYPYDSFSVVAAPIPVGLGFAGLTYVGKGILPHSYMSERSLAHEILHSWWGNAVLVDYDTGNWSEGLTNFMADYGLAEDKGPLEARQMRMDWIRQLSLLAPEEMQPLSAFVSASHKTGKQAEGYGKAAMLFHMLRDELGREVFYDGLRDFYTTHRRQRVGWQHLQASFERVSGRDLTDFFAQWVTGVGMPRLTLSDVAAREGNQLSFTLAQDGAAYDLRVPLQLITETGTELHVVQLKDAQQRYTLTAKAEVKAVHIDPAFDLARWPAEDELSPTLDNAFALDGFNARLAAPEAEGAAYARELLEEMLNIDMSWDPEKPYPGDLVFGTTAQVASYYEAQTGKSFPAAQDGAARAWLEADSEGKMTLYISADDLEDAAAQMRFLGYYGSKSYVTFLNGRGHTFGVLPSDNSALKQVVQR